MRTEAARFFAGGALAMAVAVAAGAFGAHGLKAALTPEMLAIWETAARYNAYHGLGLFAVAWALGRVADGPTRPLKAGGWLLVAGMVLFSGSLYGYALTGLKALAMITPLGGLCFVAGWLAVAVGGWRLRA